ncbi:ATP-binding protein [Variovorax robiniae]|uniref:ATP-binding protein n=1 Tax=Variovorax robiniae TaxID=1836199 RepID=A0ABU8X015_9BURK
MKRDEALAGAAPPTTSDDLPLAQRLLAMLAPGSALPDAAPEAHWLVAQAGASPWLDLASAWSDWRVRPPAADARLHRLVMALRLNASEAFALALSHAADSDVMHSRALAWLQAPLREARPTLGLIACLDAQRGLGAAASLTALLDGAALASGLLHLEEPVDRASSRADAALRLPLPLLVALAGGGGAWAGVTLLDTAPTLAVTVQAEAVLRATRLQAADALLIRSGDPAEARAACVAIAHARNARAALIEGDPPAGLLPWLILQDALPVLCAEPGPGDRREVPRRIHRLTRHPAVAAGPLLIATGLEGSWQRDDEPLAEWRLPMPEPDERASIWQGLGHDAAQAERFARTQRHTATRIASLHARADALARDDGVVQSSPAHLHRAARQADAGTLGSLAQTLTEDIDDDALVLTPALRTDLLALAERCRHREGLADTLGPAARTRYRPGVRALLVGPSGTGKTLACGWLATRLSKPLFRVDLAGVTSKWIGETEKNLGELFARAEHADVVLLFDEADSLFGKRTEVKDANDRYANQQTNYLLQRIETYDGIVLLTSNSRSRFDSAFTRRLDAILDFPAPGPGERRALWLAHLGDGHALTASGLNRLAAGCDFAGGHVRNVVLTARAIAGRTGLIDWPALGMALQAEYRKLGRAMPAALVPAE